jgi:hypothetical protein
VRCSRRLSGRLSERFSPRISFWYGFLGWRLSVGSVFGRGSLGGWSGMAVEKGCEKMCYGNALKIVCLSVVHLSKSIHGNNDTTTIEHGKNRSFFVIFVPILAQEFLLPFRLSLFIIPSTFIHSTFRENRYEPFSAIRLYA